MTKITWKNKYPIFIFYHKLNSSNIELTTSNGGLAVCECCKSRNTHLILLVKKQLVVTKLNFSRKKNYYCVPFLCLAIGQTVSMHDSDSLSNYQSKC